MNARRLNRDVRYQVTVPKSERERQIALYAELAAESERSQQINATLQVDALLDRVRQPEPAEFCAPYGAEDAEPAAFVWLMRIVFVAAMASAFWLAGLWVTA